MFDDFLLRALLTAIAVALAAAPLGCFMVWRRMAYFGDAMAHSALLGVGLGFLLGLDPTLGVMAATLSVALLLIALQHTGRIATDTLLGILSHAALSLGMVLLALMSWLRLDLMGYLFGDVLAVSWTEVGLAWLGSAVTVGILMLIWRPLLALTINEDLARAEGVRSLFHRIVLIGLLASVIAVAMKVVGILLITSLLIIPAATARAFARSPESMALVGAAVGVLASGLGLFGSLRLDTPAGPSIVVAAALLFAVSVLLRPLLRRAI